MVCPDPAFRITAMQAYHHPALQPAAQEVIITPHFVRAATNPDIEDEPLPPIPYDQARPHSQHQKGTVPHAQGQGEEGKRKKIKVKNTKDRNTVHSQQILGPRSATPTALGESIKQHTSAAKPKREKDKGKGKTARGIENEHERESGGHGMESPKKGSKLVIKNMSHRWSDIKGDEEDPTRQSSFPLPMPMPILISFPLVSVLTESSYKSHKASSAITDQRSRPDSERYTQHPAPHTLLPPCPSVNNLTDRK